MDIAAYLREKRKELKIPRWKIAKKLCISPQALRDIENGVTRLSLENFLIICEELNISPMQLIKKTNEHYILLNDNDLITVSHSIEILQKIMDQADSGISSETNAIEKENKVL